MAFGEQEEYDKKIALPCHLAEYKQLEAFLEQKARDGLMIQYFSPLFNLGYFSYTAKKNYHCCVDVYYQAVTDEIFDSDAFNEYLDICKLCGWVPRAYYKNIIIFYSEAEERPADLQSDEELTYELLKKITMKIEFRMLLTETLSYLFPCLCLVGLIISTRNHYRFLNNVYAMDSQIIDLTIIIGLVTYLALKITAHLRVLHALRHNLPLPDKTGAWTGTMVANVETLVFGSCVLYLCIKWGGGGFALLSALLLVFYMGYCLYLHVQKNHENKLYLQLTRYSIAVHITCILSLFTIFLVMVLRLPRR